MTVLNDKELKKFEADRDFSAELLASVEQMVAGNSVLKASELKKFEKGRDIDAEILQAIEEMRSGVALVEHVIQIPDVES